MNIKPMILNDNSHYITTLNTRKFQSVSRHLRLLHFGIYKAIARDNLILQHISSTKMLVHALTKPLPSPVSLQFCTNIGLGLLSMN
jgi:hypothetical protein